MLYSNYKCILDANIKDKEITRYYLGLDTTDLTIARFILLVPDPWDPDENDLDEYFSYAEKNCVLVAIVEIKGEKSIFIYDKGSIGQNTEIFYAEEYEDKFNEKYGTPQKILGSYL